MELILASLAACCTILALVLDCVDRFRRRKRGKSEHASGMFGAKLPCPRGHMSAHL